MSTTVGELIEFLQQFKNDMPVAYQLYSESKLLDLEEIEIQVACVAREDGWIQHKRPDKPQTTYLMFPGN